MYSNDVVNRFHADCIGSGLPPCSVFIQAPRRKERCTDKLRGPEVERWFGVEDGSDPALENEWNFLPFMALTDGAHAYVLNNFSVQGESEGPMAERAWADMN